MPVDYEGTEVESLSNESKESHKLYNQYRSARSAWYRDRVENENFYHNQQYTETEKTEIESRGQAPLQINVLYSIVKQMIAILTSTEPKFTVYPVKDADKDVAYVYRSLLDSMWYDSRGDIQLSMITKDTLISGLGWGMINPRFDHTFGMKFQRVPYHQVYVDPSASELDFSDADNILISRVTTSKKAAKLIGEPVEAVEQYKREFKESSIVSAYGQEEEAAMVYPRYTAPLEGQNTVRVIQRLSIEDKDVFVVEPRTALIDGIGQKVYFEKTERLNRQEADGLISIKEVNRKVLAKYITVGSKTKRYYLPIDTYNIIPFIDEFNGNPYPLGEVDFLYGLQRALNKFILLAILNATLSNNMKMMAPEGAIDNIADWERSYSIAGAMLTYKWAPEMPPPQQINPQPLSNAFLDMPRMLISIMEYITGIFGVVQGNPEGAPGTASGLISLQSYGGQKTKLIGRNLNAGLTRCGDVAIQLYQNYAPFNQVVNEFNGSGVGMVNYNQLEVQRGGRISVKNDLSKGKYKAQVLITPNYGTERQMKAKVLADLSAQTRSPSLIPAILKLADIPEADEIAEQIDEVANLTQQLGQQEEAMKRMEEVNKQLENQVRTQAQKVDGAKFSAELDKIKNKFEKQYGIEAAKMIADLQQLVKGS